MDAAAVTNKVEICKDECQTSSSRRRPFWPVFPCRRESCRYGHSQHVRKKSSHCTAEYVRTYATYVRTYDIFCLAVESHKSPAGVTNLHKTHTKFLFVCTYVRTYEQPAHSTQHIKAHTTQARQARPPRPTKTKVQQGITLSRSTFSSCTCG